MRTALNGYGSFRKELLRQIYSLKGMNPFTYADVKTLPEFKRETFFKLVYGDYILIYKRGNPTLYVLNEPPLKHSKGGQTAEEWFNHSGLDAENIA